MMMNIGQSSYLSIGSIRVKYFLFSNLDIYYEVYLSLETGTLGGMVEWGNCENSCLSKSAI